MPASVVRLSFSPPPPLPRASALLPSPPRALPRVAQHYRSKAAAASAAAASAAPHAPPAACSPAEWVPAMLALCRSARALEDELADILRAHAEGGGGGAAAAEGVPWGDLLQALTASERLAAAERQQLGRELAGLRAQGGASERPAAMGALREFRERQRQAYGALCGEERAASAAVGTRAILDLLAALDSSSAAHRAAALPVVAAPRQPAEERKCGEGEEEVQAEEEPWENEGGGGKQQEEAWDGKQEQEEQQQQQPEEEEGGEEAHCKPHPRSPAASAASPASPASPASTLQHLQRRCEAVKQRVEALDAQGAQEAHGGALAHGWDALDKSKGGAEDLAALSSVLTRYLTSKDHLQRRSREGEEGEEGGEGSAAWKVLSDNELALLVKRANEVLPGRTPAALAAQVVHLLKASARRTEKLAAVVQWKSLRGALEVERRRAAAAAAAASGGGGGGGSAAAALNASFGSAGKLSSAAQGGSSWRGPDALTRIAVVEWRAEQGAARAAQEAAAAAAGRAREAEAAAARGAWLARQRAQLSQWVEEHQGETAAASAGEGGNGAILGPSKAHSLRIGASRPPPLPPAGALGVCTPGQLLRRSAAAIAAAAAQRRRLEEERAAAAAAASERRGDARVAQALARVAAGGALSAAAGGGGGGGEDYAFPERATEASVARAVSRRELREAQAQRVQAAAHAAKVASVNAGARGRGFGVGCSGALPTLAVPKWRKGL